MTNYLKKFLLTIGLITFITFLILPFSSLLAQPVRPEDVLQPTDIYKEKDLEKFLEESMTQVGKESGYGTAYVGQTESTVISEKVGTIISWVLAFLGVIFLVITIYSGIQWMAAGGNEETVKKARTRLINAVIGLIIVMAAYAITWFVVNKMQQTITPSSSVSNLCPAPYQCMRAMQCYQVRGTVLTEYTCANAEEICCVPSPY